MITLIIENSECQFTGLTLSQFKEIRDLMSYSLPHTVGYYTRNYHSPKKHLMDRRGRFPTGLLYIAKQYLENLDTDDWKIEDHRILPDAQEGTFLAKLDFQPYPEQIEAARAAKKAARGIIAAPTGTGKSVIIALIIQELQVRTLVVVPSLELKRQLQDTLTDYFGPNSVGEGKDIWVQNIDGLPSKIQLNTYSCVIIDEFHHAAAKTYRVLNKTAWKNIYYRIGLTATPFRSQDTERLLLESVLSETIYKIDYHTAVSKGYICPIEAYYYEIPKTKTSGTTWTQIYSQLVVNNKLRNDLITELLVKLHVNGVSTLCLVKEISHGHNLAVVSSFNFVHGQSDERHLIESFAKGNTKTLIGTTGVIGEGVNTKACEYVIIAGLGKSKTAFMQQVGRTFRKYSGKESGKIIIFLDTSHKWTKEHFKAQVKILRDEYGIEPIKL